MNAPARRNASPDTLTAGQRRAAVDAWRNPPQRQAAPARYPVPPAPPRWLMLVWCAAWLTCLGVAVAVVLTWILDIAPGFIRDALGRPS